MPSQKLVIVDPFRLFHVLKANTFLVKLVSFIETQKPSASKRFKVKVQLQELQLAENWKTEGLGKHRMMITSYDQIRFDQCYQSVQSCST